eukprot:6185832-Pleurochrysis_carterae.AAC.1
MTKLLSSLANNESGLSAWLATACASSQAPMSTDDDLPCCARARNIAPAVQKHNSTAMMAKTMLLAAVALPAVAALRATAL